METTKPWSISASLRGFYDDNINTEPTRTSKTASFGYELSPAGAVRYSPTEQTHMRLEYIYSMKYFENRPDNKIDQSHSVNGKLEHQFSELYKVKLDDSFVYSQEPEVIETVQSLPTLRRHSDNVLRNRAAIEFDAKVSDRATVVGTYENTYYNYQFQDYQTLLNRLEHLLGLEGRWELQQTLSGLLGYNYGIRDFTSSDIIPGTTIKGSDRSSSSHYFYGGATKALSTQLNGTVKVGAEYTEYDLGNNTWNPFADLSLTYTYLPGSYVQLGFIHARNATDVVQPSAGNPLDITQDAQSSTVYAQLTHRITHELTGSLLGQYQHSTFRGGAFNDTSDNLYLVGANLAYTFNEHWSTELGYNLDNLNSEIVNRGFIRNRVYIGVRASY